MRNKTSIFLITMFIFSMLFSIQTNNDRENKIENYFQIDANTDEILNYKSKINSDKMIYFKSPDETSIPSDISTAGITEILNLLDLNDLTGSGYLGDNITVAVIDTGIDHDHPAFANTEIVAEKSFVKTEYGYNEDEGTEDTNGHGTSVASIILGNSTTYTGAAPNAKLVVAKVYGGGLITSAGLIAAIKWTSSLDFVDIISMSLSEPEEGVTEDPLEQAVKLAADRGKIVFMSAGNNGKSASSIDYFTMGSPSASPHAITVGATDNFGNMASYSSNGPTTGWEAKPDVVAPGTGIPSARVGGGEVSRSGTSFSTPIVAGVTASLLSALKSKSIIYNSGMIKSALASGARDLGRPWPMQGNGHVNISSSLDYITDTKNEYATIFPNVVPIGVRSELPAGEILDIKVTATSNIEGNWFINSTSNNLENFVEIINTEYENYLSQIITIRFTPPKDTIPGIYTGEIILNTPNNNVLSLAVTINILIPAKSSILIDLAHTPWDSLFYASGRLDRMFGRDVNNLIQILRSNNIWVDEFLTGNLNNDLLSRYDILWMPSAFTVLSPAYADHDINRNTILTPNELQAIARFTARGGDLILDFAGTTVYDSEFDTRKVDESSIRSILAVFDVSITDTIKQDSISVNAVAVNGSDLYNSLTSYSIKSGVNYLRNGMKILGKAQDTTSVGIFGRSGSRVFISNARNWRDGSQNIGFQSEIIDWITDNKGIQQIFYTQKSDETVFSIELLDNISYGDIELEISTINYDDSRTVISHNIKNIVNNTIFEISVPKITRSRVSINISFGTYYDDFVLFVDDSQPEFTDKNDPLDTESLISKLKSTGVVEWRYNIIDTEDYFKYQVNTEITSLFADHIKWEYKPITEKAGYVSVKLYLSILDEFDLGNVKDLFTANIFITQSNNRLIEKSYNVVLYESDNIPNTSTENNSTTTKSPINPLYSVLPVIILIYRKKYNKNY